MNTYRAKILKEFKIDRQRRSSWLCYKVWVLSKTQDLTTAEERERTKVVPYALDVGVGERSNFKKFPTHTQDHGDA